MKGVFNMRKKDLENLHVIKTKFDNNIPDIPPSLAENRIKYKILLNTQHRTIPFKPAANYKPIISAAACFVLILCAVFAVNWYSLNADKVTTFGSYDELNSRITALDKCPPGEYGGHGGPAKTVHQKRDANVEFPAEIKTDGEYIYFADYDTETNINRNKIYICNLENGSNGFVALIDHLAPDMVDEYDDSYQVRDLFVYNNRLAIIMDKINPMSADKYKRDFNAAVIKIYDITDKSNPFLITEYEQSGEYFESRMIDNTLFVSTNYEVATDDTEYTVPRIYQNGESLTLSLKDIACFDNVKASQYAVLTSIDVESGNQAENTKAFLGGSPKIYCTKDYIYINEYVEGERFGDPEHDVASAMKINLQNNKISFASAEEIDAYANVKIELGKGTSYAYDIYPIGENYLCIGDDLNTFQNEIILYDKALNVLDSFTFEDMSIMSNLGDFAFDAQRGVCAFAVYKPDEIKRNYGIITVAINDNKITVTNEFMYDGYNPVGCLITSDSVIEVFVDYTKPDDDRIELKINKY